MAAEDSPAGDSIRTMREDLKKARMGSRPALQGKKRLAEIIDHAEGGEGVILRSQPTKPTQNLDDLLPIEPAKSPEGNQAGPPQSEGLGGDIVGGSPPPNLPGVRAPTPPPAEQPRPEAAEPPAEKPDSVPRTTAKPTPRSAGIAFGDAKPIQKPVTPHGLEEDEEPQETPEELLDLSTPPPKVDRPLAGTPVSPQDITDNGKPGPWKFVAALVAIIAVGSVTGFLVWNFLITGGEESTPPPEDSQLLAEIKAPNPLFPADFEAIVKSPGEVRALESSSGSPESVIYTPYYFEDKKKFANPEELFAALNMRAPSPFFRLLNEAVSPYVYIPGTEEQERCEQEGITSRSCFSPRLGMIFHVTPVNLDLVRGVMEDWESTMAQDVRPMVFGNPSLPPTEFSSATYRGIAVRFINLPTSTTAVNYALTDSFVVIATSKNSLYNVLDRIIEITGGTK